MADLKLTSVALVCVVRDINIGGNSIWRRSR